MGGSFASTFVPLSVGGKYSGQESGFRTELPARGVPQGQSAYLALETWV